MVLLWRFSKFSNVGKSLPTQENEEVLVLLQSRDFGKMSEENNQIVRLGPCICFMSHSSFLSSVFKTDLMLNAFWAKK